MKNLKTEPAYGADVLRLWVATVEYWRDMSFGKKALSQASESMRKIRNSFRFLLANIGEEGARPSSIEDVELGLVRCFSVLMMTPVINYVLLG